VSKRHSVSVECRLLTVDTVAVAVFRVCVAVCVWLAVCASGWVTVVPV
jgi:hypothetical protein